MPDIKILHKIKSINYILNDLENNKENIMIFAYKYMEENNYNIEKIKKEIEEIKNRLEGNWLSYYIFWEEKIKNKEDYFSYFEKNWFTELQAYFAIKNNNTNIVWILQIIAWNSRLRTVSYNEWFNGNWWYTDTGVVDKSYEVVEKENTWEKIYLAIQKSKKIDTSEKYTLRGILKEIKLENELTTDENESLNTILFKDIEIIDLIKDFF